MDSSSSNGIPRPAAALGIDYLAKDYASFRQLMLDRLASLVPDWSERNAADVGVMVVELLAYAADQLSYYQDAVATEAYLTTAHHRISMRRHARLLDYPMHEGCNARTFVAVTVADSAPAGLVLLAGSQLLTRVANTAMALTAAQIDEVRDAGAQVFETLHELVLNPAHNSLPLQGDLAAGATSATLRVTAACALKVGDLLIFEEIAGAASGLAADADPLHRHPVRITQISRTTDTRSGALSATISFAAEDAVPFALAAATTVATGNVVLADHGYSLPGEEALTLRTVGALSEATLKYGPLTQRGGVFLNGLFHVYNPTGPASAIGAFALEDARPAVSLRDAHGMSWTARRDLLRSRRPSSDFAVEIDERGQTHLRFGDGTYGRNPEAQLYARYRIGNGRVGNVGAEALYHLVWPAGWPSAQLAPPILGLRNPLMAAGGTEPEPIEQVRLHAPHSFRTQERAVSVADYVAVALRHPEVQDAQGGLRWVGAGYAISLTVQRRGGLPCDQAFQARLLDFIGRYRMAGQELFISSPREVAVDIALTVQVAPGHVRTTVKSMLYEALGLTPPQNRTLLSTKPGMLSPVELRLGRPIYLSQLVSAAMRVDGVAWAEVTRFQRYGGKDCRRAGVITMAPLEMAILRNLAAQPWLGRFELTIGGGK